MTTWDTGTAGNGLTFSNGDLTVSGGVASGVSSARSSTTKSSGLLYFRLTITSRAPTHLIGLCRGSYNVVTGSLNNEISYSLPDGTISVANATPSADTGITTPIQSCAQGDYVDVAFNLTTNRIWYRTGSNGNWNNSATANPSTGVGWWSISALSGPFYMATYCFNPTMTVVMNPTPALSGDATLTGFSPWDAAAGLPPGDWIMLA